MAKPPETTEQKPPNQIRQMDRRGRSLAIDTIASGNAHARISFEYDKESSEIEEMSAHTPRQSGIMKFLAPLFWPEPVTTICW
jgi:hypothetical protein